MEQTDTRKRQSLLPQDSQRAAAGFAKKTPFAGGIIEIKLHSHTTTQVTQLRFSPSELLFGRNQRLPIFGNTKVTAVKENSEYRVYS